MRLAIVGATGVVGETVLSILTEKKLSFTQLYLLASASSAGDSLDVDGKAYLIEDVADFDFSQADFALFVASNDVAKEYAQTAVAAGCTVIDNSSFFRNDKDVPLIVPEVNGELLKTLKLPALIANPNCSTVQMVMAIKPLHDVAKVKRINVATYQSVSGAGRAALQELVHETASLLNARSYKRQVFPKQIAFNTIPHIDDFQENGFTREEMKMVWETKKILNDDSIEVNPTAVRVPAFYAHAEALHLELEKPLTAKKARELLKRATGIKVLDRAKAGGYPTQVGDASGCDDVFVGRIRNGLDNPCHLNLWVVADNLRKGAALNAVQILQSLLIHNKV